MIDLEHPVPFSRFEGAIDLNGPAAMQLGRVLFMDGAGEFAAIAKLQRDLKCRRRPAQTGDSRLRDGFGTLGHVPTGVPVSQRRPASATTWSPRSVTAQPTAAMLDSTDGTFGTVVGVAMAVH